MQALRWLGLALALSANAFAAPPLPLAFQPEPVPFLSDMRLDALRRLAPLYAERTTVQSSPSDERMWFALTDLDYAGLSLRVVEFADRPETGIVAVEIRSSTWHSGVGFDVGANVQAVLDMLGPPDETAPQRLTYYGDGTTLIIDVRAEHVSAIIIYYHWC